MFNGKFCALDDLVINIKLASWIWHNIAMKCSVDVTFYDCL